MTTYTSPFAQPDMPGGEVVYHVNADVDPRPTVTVKVTRNSKGYTWECGAYGGKDPMETIALVTDLEAQMRAQYGESES